jgi:O-antigen ligase
MRFLNFEQVARCSDLGAPMSETALQVATWVFWILVPLIVILPLRYALVVYLLLIQIDLAGLGNVALTSVGVTNVIRVVLLPTLLLWRTGLSSSSNPELRKLSRWWVLFASYVVVAVVWSPYKIPALKMTGYIYAYSVLFMVFVNGWRKEWFNRRCLCFVLWASLFGATVQSFVLGNSYGSNKFEWRFTSFTGAQSFAPFLLCLIVLLLFSDRWTVSTVAAGLGGLAGLILTGSRSVFLGLVWVLFISGFLMAARAGQRVNLRLVLRRTVLGIASICVILAVVVTQLPDNRLNEMLLAMVSKDSTIDDIGTFGWRFSLYQTTLEELAGRDAGQLIVGSGTSSGARLVLDAGIDQEESVDPNRALHDEFLRSLYEWGLVGLFSLILFLFQAFRVGLSKALAQNSLQGWAFLAIFVPMLISLTVENFLADGASPGGVGYSLVLTSMLASGIGRA